MTTRMTGLLLCVVLGMPVAAWAGAAEDDQAELDAVLRLDQAQPTRTKVVSEDFLMVEGRHRNATVKVPAYRVVDVLRADRPAEYDRGLERFKEGRYAVAARYFTDVLLSRNHKDKPWVIEYCNFRLGEAMYEGGHWNGYGGTTYRYDPPFKYYAKVIAAHPKSRFLLDASVKLAISQTELDSFDDAEKSFVAAASAIRQYRDETARTGDPEYRTLADRAEALMMAGRARLLEKRGKLPEATDLYVKSQRMAKKSPEVYVQSTDGELRCLMKQNRFGEARTRAEALIRGHKESGDPVLTQALAGAYSALGMACLAQAGEHEARNNAVQAQQAYADARWNYLQVLVEFHEREEYMEQAGYFAGLCYDKLKNQEPNGKQMAIRYWLSTRRGFPNGEFGKKAAEELVRLGYKDPQQPTAPGKAEPSKKPAGAKG